MWINALSGSSLHKPTLCLITSNWTHTGSVSEVRGSFLVRTQRQHKGTFACASPHFQSHSAQFITRKVCFIATPLTAAHHRSCCNQPFWWLPKQHSEVSIDVPGWWLDCKHKSAQHTTTFPCSCCRTSAGFWKVGAFCFYSLVKLELKKKKITNNSLLAGNVLNC